MLATMVGAELEATLACVREQYSNIADACATLAGSLRTGSIDEGLRALERICATLLIAEELIEAMARASAPDATMDEAHHARERMMIRATPWIAAAVRDLPGAEEMVRRFALSQREEPPPGERSGWTQ